MKSIFSGSSTSSCALPVEGLYVMFTRSWGATDPSFAMTFLAIGSALAVDLGRQLYRGRRIQPTQFVEKMLLLGLEVRRAPLGACHLSRSGEKVRIERRADRGLPSFQSKTLDVDNQVIQHRPRQLGLRAVEGHLAHRQAPAEA